MKRSGQMELAKQEYERIEIPEELSGRVEKWIEQYGHKKEEAALGQRRKRWFLRGAASAAAAVLVFAVCVNTSTAFAGAMDEVPILGGLARVFTFRSYSEEKEDIGLSVEIPSVEMIAEANSGLTESVNQEIHELCEQYAQEAMARAEAYRQAFLDTGGTEAEWTEHHIAIQVGYEIKSQTEHYLSFMIWGNESWSSAFDTARYYTMDLVKQELVTLKELLGEDYITIANQSIRTQMKEREAKGVTFFTEDEGGFAGITQESSFYLNENGNPVIVFEKYQIAPGAYGVIEFEIGGENSKLAGTAEHTNTDIRQGSEEAIYYEDNFAVEQEAADEFAERIKQVVEEQDMEALADLVCYPLYVGRKDGSISVNNREELIALGAETIFTPELSEAIQQAAGELSPSRAGFVLADGRPNIVFGVRDGKLGIQGINY